MSQVATSEVFEKIKTMCIEQVGCSPQQVVPEASFMGDLNFDSLDQVEMIMKVEEEYGFDVPEAEGEQLRTVGDAVAYIERRLAEPG
jgi:acyl carrier protein